MTYTVEPHGAGWALYKGRTNDRHGYRLCNLTDGDQAIYAAIADALNRSAEAAEAVRAKNKAAWSAAILEANEIAMAQWPCNAPTFPQGFIPWHGGECPVAGRTVVDCVMRGRYVVHKNTAKSLRWYHLDDGDTRTITNIIAYRIHKPADFRLEAGKFYVTASGWREGPMRVHADELFDLSDSDNRLWFADGRSASDPRHDILALSSNQESGHD